RSWIPIGPLLNLTVLTYDAVFWKSTLFLIFWMSVFPVSRGCLHPRSWSVSATPALGVAADGGQRKLRDVIGQPLDVGDGISLVGEQPPDHLLRVAVKAALPGDAHGAVADRAVVNVGAEQLA